MENFSKASIEHQLATLQSDAPDFPQTKSALRPSMEYALAKTERDPKTSSDLAKLLQDAVVVAARKYLGNLEKNRQCKFSVYYSWYMAELVNTYDDISGIIRSKDLAPLLTEDKRSFRM